MDLGLAAGRQVEVEGPLDLAGEGVARIEIDAMLIEVLTPEMQAEYVRIRPPGRPG